MIDVNAIAPGDQIVAAPYGPLTIVDTVRWAGVQENTGRLHWDREYCREQAALRSFIASGAYRQALLIRALTDWLGFDGVLRKLRIRHVAPTFEGDMMNFSASVTQKTKTDDGWLISCDLRGTNQEGQEIMTGQCALVVNPREAAGDRGR